MARKNPAPQADPRDVKITKLEGQNASLRQQVKELRARVSGETLHSHRGWTVSRSRGIALTVMAELLTEANRHAGFRDPAEEFPF